MWNLDSNFGYQQQQSNYYLQKEIENKLNWNENLNKTIDSLETLIKKSPLIGFPDS